MKATIKQFTGTNVFNEIQVANSSKYECDIALEYCAV
jgi:hypothetical protein